MRKILSVMVIAAFILSCNQNKPAVEEKKEDSTKVEAKKADNINYPYAATYSSSFEMGKPENAKIILDLWKAYEDNKLDDTRAMWADSVVMEFDGFTFRGKPERALQEAKADRDKYTSVKDSVAAWMPIHSIDRNEDWVAVWALEYTINKKGKKDTADIHEIWRLKDGKVQYMSQYRAHRKP